MHPVPLYCSSIKYYRYSPLLAPRRSADFLDGTLGGGSCARRASPFTEEKGPEARIGVVESPDPGVEHVVGGLRNGKQGYDDVVQCVWSREGKRDLTEGDCVFLPDKEIPEAFFEVGQHKE